MNTSVRLVATNLRFFNLFMWTLVKRFVPSVGSAKTVVFYQPLPRRERVEVNFPLPVVEDAEPEIVGAINKGEKN